ncbi:hypothetical protein CR513_58350, partial [Mucuna pruriens]
MEIYTNADYAKLVVDRRSTFNIFLGANLVTWRSKKQNMKYNFKLWHTICERLWIKIILDDLKLKYEGPLKLFVTTQPLVLPIIQSSITGQNT